MHFCIDWKKPWTIPEILKQTSIRQKEMEHMGAAYMAEGIVLYRAVVRAVRDIHQHKLIRPQGFVGQ